MGKIKTTISCSNYAPLKNLKGEIDSDNLCIAIYADNGEGKTFISKAFRLIENSDMPLSDKYLSFGESKGYFNLRISSDKKQVEQFQLNFEQGELITCLKPSKYIFHTFNQEFIDENIRSFSFDKKQEHINEYIIGKTKIDLKEEETKKDLLVGEATKKREEILFSINKAIRRIDNISNIKRIQEYNLLTEEYIFSNYKNPIANVTKTSNQYITEYDLIKSIPENPDLLKELRLPILQQDLFSSIQKDLEYSFSVSSIAEDFKEKIKSKQRFIENGLRLLSGEEKCPFCEQTIVRGSAANILIDKYIEFFKEEEAKLNNKIQGYIADLNSYAQELKATSNSVLSEKSKALDYITRYIPSASDKDLQAIDIGNICDALNRTIGILQKKIDDISISYSIKDIYAVIDSEHQALQTLIKSINANILAINSILIDSANTNRNIRRDICRALFNEIIANTGALIDESIALTAEKDKIIKSIIEKRNAEKVKRIDKVSETIKSVLEVFFRGKYTFDDKDFSLKCQGTSLSKGQATHVLSEGEKSIIAFAYYLGDVFVKIQEEDDYEKLFLVIDDPISSMDFNYVYILSTIIRDFSSYIPTPKHSRVLLLTHNLEFMRIIIGNRIIGNCYILKNNKLQKFNSTFAIPYISHLNDVYNISIGQNSVNHTTANSIRHILESLLKFENPAQNASLEDFVKTNLPDDKYAYTLIQDLSHGGVRTTISPICDDYYINICKYIILFLTNKYPGQIEFCKTLK